MIYHQADSRHAVHADCKALWQILFRSYLMHLYLVCVRPRILAL